MSAYSTMAETIAEFSLLVAVLGAGLRIDRRFLFRGWGSVWRLLFIVMPLSIAAGAFAARELLGLSLGLAVLLGAITSPTDPVLAAGV
jgi:sodium/hydrogen antiporter